MLFCPASRAGPFRGGSLTVSISGSSKLVLKKTSQEMPHSGPWQKRLCDGPDSDDSVVWCPMQTQKRPCQTLIFQNPAKLCQILGPGESTEAPPSIMPCRSRGRSSFVSPLWIPIGFCSPRFVLICPRRAVWSGNIEQNKIPAGRRGLEVSKDQTTALWFSIRADNCVSCGH